MKKIKVSKDFVSLVSNADYLSLLSHKWYMARGYVYCNYTKGKTRTMHRMIMEKMLGGLIPKDRQVDHINRNKLDNRRENLRLATLSENRVNSSKRINYSGFRGVKKPKGRNRWQAEIMKNSKKIFLGCFDTKEEAALAYNQRAIELFGEFAYLNKI